MVVFGKNKELLRYKLEFWIIIIVVIVVAVVITQAFTHFRTSNIIIFWNKLLQGECNEILTISISFS